MRFYHKLAFLGLLALARPVQAQPAAPPVPPEQDVDDDYAQQQQQGMPPADPNYAQGQPQADAQQYGYMGPHPIPYDVGQGFCYQQGAHFHEYAPFDQNLFRESGGWFYFVGDAADFGYQQQMWGYRGNHPIPGAYGGGYCFIDWPHRHHYAPAAGMVFNMVGGYYAYGGAWDPLYWQLRPRYAPYYASYYRRSYFGGVYWRTRPAPVYRARIVVGAPGVYRPGAVAVAPGGVRVNVVARPYGRPGVYGGRPGAVVGAPRPYAPGPRPGVVVGSPRPYAPGPRAGVVVGAPRPVGGGRPVEAPAAHPVAPAGHPVAAPHPAGHSGGGGNHHH